MVISLVQIEVFLLILARVVGIFMEAPLFSDKSLPRTVKTALMFTFSFLMWFVVPFSPELMPQDPALFLLACFNEFLVGFILGLVTSFIFHGIEAAGELMGAQMGLSVATILDPSSGQQVNAITRFLRWIFVIIFLIVNGHHFLLVALERSYSALPLLRSWNIAAGAQPIIDLGVNIFAIGLQLAAPIILTIFLIDFAFGMISRVAPQVNVFMLGFQLKPPVGMFILLLTIPLLTERIVWLINMVVEEYVRVLYYLR